MLPDAIIQQGLPGWLNEPTQRFVALVAKQAADESAKETMHNTMRLLGIDMDDQNHINEFRSLMDSVRRNLQDRSTSTSHLKSAMFSVAVSILTMAIGLAVAHAVNVPLAFH